MADTVIVYAPSGRRMRTTRRQYERVWKPAGWRLTKTSGSPSGGSTQEGAQPASKEK